MVFSSFVFLFYFLPAVLAGYFIIDNRTWRNVALFIASLFFYAWGEPICIFLMLVSIAINWFIALAIQKYARIGSILLAFGVSLNLAAIGIFKYSGFILKNLPNLFPTTWYSVQIALPIGISFYTFQAISYLVDTYRGHIAPQKNPFYFGCYLSMFPQLIAGPIVRYQTIEKEIGGRKENKADFVSGMNRFVIGLGKKVLIANTMGMVADALFAADPSKVGMIPAWYGFIAYSLQIYFDFSGYSDMAIGLGCMFGFHFLENFNYPYISRSITEFWRRWHISLSSFFRDYVYIPLGGNRCSTYRWIIHLMVVWSLTGLWHGASWNFVTWGLYYGVLMVGEKLVWGKLLQRIHRITQHLYAILLITIGWVIFRIEDFSLMMQWIKCLFGGYGIGHPATLSALNVLHYYPWLIIGAIGSTPLMARGLSYIEQKPAFYWARDICLVSFLLWSIVELTSSGFNPFIYFKF